MMFDTSVHFKIVTRTALWRILRTTNIYNKWLKVQLQGIESNRNGIGARVEIYGAWGKQIREVRSGQGFSHMSSLNTHFGIGTANAIEKVVVRWPSGTVDTIMNPSSNQALTVVEGSFPLAVNQVANGVCSVYPNPADEVLNVVFNDKSAVAKTAQVFDLSGKQIINTELTNQSLEVKALATGSYILVLKDAEGKQYTQKFVKK